MVENFLSIMNECIPKKTITHKCTLPWMNKFIQTKIKKRNSAYKSENKLESLMVTRNLGMRL